MIEQIKPLNHSVAAIWEHETSDYPDLIKVPMEDGKVVSFRREIEFPHPSYVKAIGNIRNMAVGYKMEKPADEATSNRPIRNETTNSIPPRRRRSNGGGLKNDRP